MPPSDKNLFINGILAGPMQIAQLCHLYSMILAGPVQIAQLCHLYSVENLLEHNTYGP